MTDKTPEIKTEIIEPTKPVKRKKVSKPTKPLEPIDTAVKIRKLNWECACGNTNTHDLIRCGKCRELRFQ